MVSQFFFAFLLTVSFAVIFRVPYRFLIWCGMIGAAGWMIYLIGGNMWSLSVCAFVSTCFVAIASTVCSRLMRKPINIFLIPGIFPLIPGGYIFNAVFELVDGSISSFLEHGFVAIKISVMIVFAIMLIVTIPKTLRKNYGWMNYR